MVDKQLQSTEHKPLATFQVPAAFVEGLQGDYVFVMAKADSKGVVKALATVPANSAGVTKWAKQQLALFLSNETAAATKAAKVKRKNKAVEVAVQASKNKTPAAEETVGDLVAA